MKKVGIAGIQQQKKLNENLHKIGDELYSQQLEQMQAQMVQFKEQLEIFAKKYKNDIKKDETFRQNFQSMCTSIGVDPLASSKGFWGEILGVGDFYYELAVQIIQVCYLSRSRNGGLIEINELKKTLTEIRGKKAVKISVDDITRALKNIEILGTGFSIIKIGDKKMIQSVPRELNSDTSSILLLAQKKGYVSTQQIQNELNWSLLRINQTLESLIKEGICWLDDYNGQKNYYVACYFQNELA
ncbi:winged helix DNA-binding domain-containing protein [Anaeromyces robustus]|uniref:Vacuolar-sorting protein SNF8 n=1 Tax=Anaeromyces robustus TaxID=1754192 RepID=A0A1Y1WUZ8_9FUNG|nr:winged helix DNA-binding domain-containing protein [Anaeromyces robustus]|eukprot:ORX77370.1 winged helix DNA-binding domain-containing protein [Anaeromyces robustus]